MRARTGSGDASLIIGVIVKGSSPKPLLIRGIGPGLRPFGLTEVANDPSLHLYTGSTLLADNDNWGGGADLKDTFSKVGAFPLAEASLDAGFVHTVTPGAYTVHLRDQAGSGVGLVECYDANREDPDSYLHNISARNLAGTGSDVLTVGFIVAGTSAKPVLIRGVGPSLKAFISGDTITRAELKVFDADGRALAMAADWNRSVIPASAFPAVGAFPFSAASGDSVVLLGLAPGAYTAQVRNLSGGPAAAMIEVYSAEDVVAVYPALNPVSAPMREVPVDPDSGTPSPGEDSDPRVILQGPPTYPFELRRSSVTGEVRVGFYVKANGEVASPVALRATDSRFAESAVAAVSGWRFIPARKNGRLVTTPMQVPIIYSISYN